MTDKVAAYYNEFDPKAAAWLRQLISDGLIAPGDVDERSIADVLPGDLDGYTQCHFFAGIGIWSYGLRNAGWTDDRAIWTGSCPCQPFSSAGAGKGVDDERHLWPVFHELISACRPGIVLGEQVASADVIGKARPVHAGKDSTDWLDLVQTDLEGSRYEFGAVVTPAASVGAPHIRMRTWWMAYCDVYRHKRAIGQGQAEAQRESGRHAVQCSRTDRLGNTGRQPSKRNTGELPEAQGKAGSQGCADGYNDNGYSDAGEVIGMADNEKEQRHRTRSRVTPDRKISANDSERSRMADTASRNTLSKREQRSRDHGQQQSDNSPVMGPSGEIGASELPADTGRPGPTNGFWRDADWLGCRDGKWRPAKSGTKPLVAGPAGRMVSGSDQSAPINADETSEARVMRLRGYGNAINAESARVFVECVMDVVGV